MAAAERQRGRARTPVAGIRRVVWVNRFFYPDESATSIMLTDLVRALSSDGAWRHRLVTSNANYASQGKTAPPIPGVKVHRITAVGNNNRSLLIRLVNFVFFYAGALFYLSRHTRRGDLVVALTDPPLIGVIVTLVARLKGAHSVHWVQDIFPETASRLGFVGENRFLDRTMRKLRNWSWCNASANIAIGERMRSFIVDNGIKPESVQVIQNWANDEAILPVASQENSIRRDWDYREGDCVIGYSGNLGRAHDIDTMIGSMQLLGDRGPGRARFLYIGGGAKQEDLRKAAGQLPEGMVSFRPYQPMEKLAESLSAPDIHWIPLQPDLEGLIVPSKLYGALAVGRPVIFVGDEEGEIPRILRQASCGASFAPGESEELAAYISMLAEEPEKRRQLGANGRAYLDRELRRSLRIGQWRGLIARLLA